MKTAALLLALACCAARWWYVRHARFGIDFDRAFRALRREL